MTAKKKARSNAQAELASKNYGERILFEGLTFGLSKGDKMALIANNGTS